MKILVFILILITMSALVLAVTPNIEFTAPTPNDDANQTEKNTTVTINVSVSDSSSHNFSSYLDWNNTMLMWFSMDANDSNAILDNSTYEHIGNFSGVGFSISNITTGIRGNALKFDGKDDIINISTSVDLDIDYDDDWSVSFWFNTSSVSANQRIISDVEDVGGGFFEGWEIYMDSVGRVLFLLVNPDGVLSIVIADTDETGFNDGEWHHAVVQWDYDGDLGGDNMLIYIDGVEMASTVFSNLAVGSIKNNIPVYIGTRYASAMSNFSGQLDEVMIQKRILTPDEVNASYLGDTYNLYTEITTNERENYTYKAYTIDIDGNINQTEKRTINMLTTVCTTCAECNDRLTKMAQGETTYLINDINNNAGNCISFPASHDTLDCQGYKIDGTDTGDGIGLGVLQLNNTVKNCNITDFQNGARGVLTIYFYSINNSFYSNNNYGILFSASGYYHIINTTIEESGIYDVAVSSFYGTYLCNQTFDNVNGSGGLPIAWFDEDNSSQTVIDKDFSEVFLCNSGNISMDNITITGSSTLDNNGILLYGASSDYNNFSNINSSDNNYGILLSTNTDYNRFINITTYSNKFYGIYLTLTSTNNYIENHQSDSDTSAGIRLHSGCTYNNITKSVYKDGANGVWVSSNAQYNRFFKNNITGNSNAGIYLNTVLGLQPNYNYFYNNLLNNTGTFNNLFISANLINYFNISKDCTQRSIMGGLCSGGNYWTDDLVDYSTNCTEINGDQICDDYYNLSTVATAVDYLPLAKQDGCVCSGLDKNKIYNYSLNCIIDQDCQMGKGNITFIESGSWTCNSTIEANHILQPTINQIQYIGSQCIMTIGI